MQSPIQKRSAPLENGQWTQAGPGRKKKQKSRRRTIKGQIYFSPTEWGVLERRCDDEGENFSNWARKILLRVAYGQKVKQRKPLPPKRPRRTSKGTKIGETVTNLSTEE